MWAWDGYMHLEMEAHTVSADYKALAERSQEKCILHMDDLRSLAAMIDAVVADLYAHGSTP